jgi:hypothetical protein
MAAEAVVEQEGTADPVAQKLAAIDAHLAGLDHRIDQVIEALKALRVDVDHVRGRLNV